MPESAGSEFEFKLRHMSSR